MHFPRGAPIALLFIYSLINAYAAKDNAAQLCVSRSLVLLGACPRTAGVEIFRFYIKRANFIERDGPPLGNLEI